VLDKPVHRTSHLDPKIFQMVLVYGNEGLRSYRRKIRNRSSERTGKRGGLTVARHKGCPKIWKQHQR